MFPLFTPLENLKDKLLDHVDKLKLLDNCLKKYSTGKSDLLLGSNLCMAEVLLAPMVIRWHQVGLIRGFDGMKLCEELGLERVLRWLKAVATRESVTSTYPAPDATTFDKFKITYDVVDAKLENVVVEKA